MLEAIGFSIGPQPQRKRRKTPAEDPQPFIQVRAPAVSAPVSGTGSSIRQGAGASRVSKALGPALPFASLRHCAGFFLKSRQTRVSTTRAHSPEKTCEQHYLFRRRSGTEPALRKVVSLLGSPWSMWRNSFQRSLPHSTCAKQLAHLHEIHIGFAVPMSRGKAKTEFNLSFAIVMLPSHPFFTFLGVLLQNKLQQKRHPFGVLSQPKSVGEPFRGACYKGFWSTPGDGNA